MHLLNTYGQHHITISSSDDIITACDSSLNSHSIATNATLYEVGVEDGTNIESLGMGNPGQVPKEPEDIGHEHTRGAGRGSYRTLPAWMTHSTLGANGKGQEYQPQLSRFLEESAKDPDQFLNSDEMNASHETEGQEPEDYGVSRPVRSSSSSGNKSKKRQIKVVPPKDPSGMFSKGSSLGSLQNKPGGKKRAYNAGSGSNHVRPGPKTGPTMLKMDPAQPLQIPSDIVTALRKLCLAQNTTSLENNNQQLQAKIQMSNVYAALAEKGELDDSSILEALEQQAQVIAARTGIPIEVLRAAQIGPLSQISIGKLRMNLGVRKRKNKAGDFPFTYSLAIDHIMT